MIFQPQSNLVPMVVENNTFRQNELGVEFTAPGTLDPSEPQPDATLSRATGEGT